MPFLYHTEEERAEMLRFIGVSSEEAFFEVVSKQMRLSEALQIGKGKSEYETIKLFNSYGAMNHPAGKMVSFLGGGVYDHYVPSVVRALSERSEFLTAYTPYQPEVSQGTLQAIFEFQSYMARLTSLPIANASMYDGATALAEAALMALKITGRRSIIYSANLNPRYVSVLKTYLAGRGTGIVEIPFTSSGQIDLAKLTEALDENVAAVIVQTPNYFGVLEEPWAVEEEIKANGSLLIASVDPISLSLFKSPGFYGADIAVGEGQSLGNEMNFGGPLLGFISSRKEYIRQMPGRIVSRTTDVDGKEAYVLVLQTREQHIRREKATSNICTNQGLLALRAAIYLALLGETGFKELGRACLERAHLFLERIRTIDGYQVKFSGPLFREFVLECPMEAESLACEAKKRGILAGIPLGRYFGRWGNRCLLVAFTEKRTEEEIDRFVDTLKGIKERK